MITCEENILREDDLSEGGWASGAKSCGDDLVVLSPILIWVNVIEEDV